MSNIEEGYVKSVQFLLEEMEKTLSRESAMTQSQQYKLMQRLMRRTETYMVDKARKDNDAFGLCAAAMFSSLSRALFQIMRGEDVLMKGQKQFAIALFVHGLTLEGLSKNAAIEATARWLDIGKSSARTAYYDEKIHDEKEQEYFIFEMQREHFYKLHSGQILELINFHKARDFLCIIPDAPKNQQSRKAYQSLLEIINAPPKTPWGGNSPLTELAQKN